MKNIVIDLDDTICFTGEGSYENSIPNLEVINQISEYKKKGFKITIFTSRNMRSFKGNIGQINKYTLPVVLAWLDKHKVQFDEILVGKPWCGTEGFYVDDRAVRPDEFLKLNYSQIKLLIDGDRSKG